MNPESAVILIEKADARALKAEAEVARLRAQVERVEAMVRGMTLALPHMSNPLTPVAVQAERMVRAFRDDLRDALAGGGARGLTEAEVRERVAHEIRARKPHAHRESYPRQRANCDDGCDWLDFAAEIAVAALRGDDR